MRWRISVRAFFLRVLIEPTYAVDTDGDGLENAVETNTRIYVSPTDTGTDPDNADTDTTPFRMGLNWRRAATRWLRTGRLAPVAATVVRSMTPGSFAGALTISHGQATVPGWCRHSLINPIAVRRGRQSQTCALDDTGIVCWGSNGNGETNVPVSLSNPIAVSAGGNHTCAIDDTGVVCWGNDYAGKATVPGTLSHPGGNFDAGTQSHLCAR